MIQFKCRCGNILRVESDEAGSSMQCPKCARLIDVPLLGDLPNLNDDGTYRTDDPPPLPKARGSRVTEALHHFGAQHDDPAGYDIDLRVTPQQIAAAGAHPDPVPPPRYDPETGELIRPLEIKPPLVPPVIRSEIPLAQAAITYATGPSAIADTWIASLVTLCQPVNVLVIAIVFIIQVATLDAGLFIVAAGFFFISITLIVVELTIVSHYGNVIDEIGPEANDELPRFLRDLRGHEDIWSPLVAMMIGTLLCYAPAVICMLDAMLGHSTFLVVSDILLCLIGLIAVCTTFIGVAGVETRDIRWAEQMFLPLAATLVGCVLVFAPAGFCLLVRLPAGAEFTVAAILAIVGTIFIPAVLLTTATSGSWVNLRPDRVVAVVRQCGPRYLSPLIAWVLGVTACVAGQLIVAAGTLNWLTSIGMPASIPTMIGYPLLLAGIVAMHFFCFELGMLYRRHHQTFPWLFQRHEPVNHKQRTAQIRAAAGVRPRR
jgi:hypothetical protein